MSDLIKLSLKQARPDNQAHLLIWDTPTEASLWQVAHYNNAEQVNYRDNLIQRLDPDDKFLSLHHAIEKELDAIKVICQASPKPMVLLEGMDTLITYLRVKASGRVPLFWRNLEKTRKLESLLWILLPSPLVPQTWPKNRILRVES